MAPRRCPTLDTPPRASGLVLTRGLAKVGVMSAPDRPGVAGAVVGALAERDIAAQFVVETTDLDNRSHIVCCVEERLLPPALRAVEVVAAAIGAERVVHRGGLAVVSVHGPHFRERPGAAAAAFRAIASAGVNILAISTSLSSISSLVDEGSLEPAVRALAGAFQVPEEAILETSEGLSVPWRPGRR